MTIPVARPAIGAREIRYVTEAIEGGWISGRGAFVTGLEEGFARLAGVAHGVALSSGTAAVHLALATLDLQPGDEVVVPALTYVAPASVVRYTGATPILVDVDESWNLCPEALAAAITPRTRAVIAVHLYGRPCDIRAIQSLTDAHGIALVEDGSQAIGARVAGRAVGGHGRVSCASLYANKVVAAGEGGILTTDDAELAARARRLRDMAMAEGPYYFHDEIGFSYRLSNLEAAVGVAQLERLDEMLEARRAIQRGYEERLREIEGIELRPSAPSGTEEVCWLFSCLVRTHQRLDRDALREALAHRGIESRPFFRALTELPPFAGGAPCPGAEALATRGLSLPTWIGLDEGQLDHICGTIARALDG